MFRSETTTTTLHSGYLTAAQHRVVSNLPNPAPARVIPLEPPVKYYLVPITINPVTTLPKATTSKFELPTPEIREGLKRHGNLSHQQFPLAEPEHRIDIPKRHGHGIPSIDAGFSKSPYSNGFLTAKNESSKRIDFGVGQPDFNIPHSDFRGSFDPKANHGFQRENEAKDDWKGLEPNRGSHFEFARPNFEYREPNFEYDNRNSGKERAKRSGAPGSHLDLPSSSLRFGTQENLQLEDEIQRLRAENERYRLSLLKFTRLDQENKGLVRENEELHIRLAKFEYELSQIRTIKLTLESQLDRYRGGFEEFEKGLRRELENECRRQVMEMERQLEDCKRELGVQEAKIRLSSDREILELNAVIRDLKEQGNTRAEKIKRSTAVSEKGMVELKEKLAFFEKELENERIMRIEAERQSRMRTETFEEAKKQFESVTRDYRSKYELVPNKEKLLEEVVMELEKVNAAFRVCKEERDELRRRVGMVRLI